jgi:DNA replication protein DnaC
MSRFHPRTTTLMAKAGLAPKELEALDCPCRHQIPGDRQGFGLIGPTGTGKSWALAQHLAGVLDRSVRQQPDPARAAMLWIDGDVARDCRVRWVGWLDMARQIRARAKTEQRWVWDMTEALEDVPFLVLDDLGREEKDLRADAAQEVLQEVLERRYRCNQLLFWTSNRTQEELTAFYGGPMASRLLGTWPAYELGGQDLRLFPVDLPKASGGEG